MEKGRRETRKNAGTMSPPGCPCPGAQPCIHVHVANTSGKQKALCILYLHSYTYVSFITYAIEEDAMRLREGGVGTQEELEGRGGCDHNALYLRMKF